MVGHEPGLVLSDSASQDPGGAIAVVLTVSIGDALLEAFGARLFA